MLKKKDSDFLRYKYSLEKVFANPSTNGPAALWQLVLMDKLLNEVTQIRKSINQMKDRNNETKEG